MGLGLLVLVGWFALLLIWDVVTDGLIRLVRRP
jgi:hypothetical protein